jgi:hypothetical protein
MLYRNLKENSKPYRIGGLGVKILKQLVHGMPKQKSAFCSEYQTINQSTNLGTAVFIGSIISPE